MAIYVKEINQSVYPEAADYKLFADAAGTLTSASLVSADRGAIVCAPGSRAYCLDGTLWILSTAGTWTQVPAGLTSF